jgi:hypothetical protein
MAPVDAPPERPSDLDADDAPIADDLADASPDSDPGPITVLTEAAPEAAPVVPFLEGQAPQGLVAALIAWSITVAPAAFGRGVPIAARAVAVLALAAGLAGPCVAASVPRPLRLGKRLGPRSIGRALGISGFLALSTVAWLLSSAALQPSRLDPIRAGIGAVSWAVFALAWSDRWSLGAPPVIDERAPSLPARAALPRGALAVSAVAVVAGLAYTVLAWRVRDADRSALSHVVATGCAVWLLGAAGAVATGRGKPPSRLPRRVGAAGLRSVLVLTAVVIGGAVVLALR